MQLKEKANLILRKLYEQRDDRESHTLTEIMKGLDIYESDGDMRRLADKLEEGQLVKVTKMSGGIDVEIKGAGVEYFEDYSKYPEKLETILNWLYNRRHEGMETTQLEKLMKDLGIFKSQQEAELLADELKKGNLVRFFPTEGAGLVAGIEFEGIKYCEGSSQNLLSQPAPPTSPLNFYVGGDFHSNNGMFGNNNSHIQQTSTVANEAGELIRKIQEGISASQELSRQQKEKIIETVF